MEPSELDKRLAALRDPKAKYALIQEQLRAAPDDFAANRALLFHGRLHEPMRGRGPDFSIIKCHLFSIFEKPKECTRAQFDEKLSELTQSDLLRRVMALSAAPEAFFDAYLCRLAHDYIDLFIRGDSRYNRVAFGFARRPDAVAKLCADPVRAMLENIRTLPGIDDSLRGALSSAVRLGYAQVFPGAGL